jgi:hypothetical protein
MPKFLIEVPHEAAAAECARAIELLLKSGSHFLTHSDWGCYDGVHKSWISVEADSKEEARNLVPLSYRSKATIIQLNAFTLEEAEELRRRHPLKA